MYKVILSDGTAFENLTLNGNNFITKQEISAETFRGKLNGVTITGDDIDAFGLVGTHKKMELVQVRKYGAEYWFVLRDIPADKMRMLAIEGNIDYIAMMTGVNL